MDLVIGSGPAGVAASLALLERGREVTMIDVGRTIEPEHAAVAAPAAGLPLERWPAGLQDHLRAIEGPMEDGLPMKTNFGSTFAVRRDPELMPLELANAQILLSLARGGLSNLWGANAWSFSADDLSGWPIGPADLEAGYRAALAHVPLSAVKGDDLEADFPLHTGRLEARPLSLQAQTMLADLEKNRALLAARGVRFAPSRLAVRMAASDRDPGCVLCGCCLHGCPHDLIYSATQTLATLEKDPRFRYAGGHYAARFLESAEGVVVETVRDGDRAPVRFTGARLFVAAGGYSTPRLVMESLEQWERETIMLESQYFLVPILQWKSFPHAAEERLTTLSQLCLRMRDAGFGAHDVHLLLYTYNPLYPVVLRRTLAGLVPGLPRALVARLSSLQGYLHSDVSPRFALTLRRRTSGPPVLRIEGRTVPESFGVVRRVVRRLESIAPMLRATPVSFMTKIGGPGKSYHSGGTYPMRHEPKEGESDVLGRPAGLRRVHLVDASVFTTIPATNMTLTVMANAWRIAAAAAALDAAGTPAARGTSSA